MNTNMEKIFKENIQSTDVIEQLFTILNLPDEQFDVIYPDFSNSIQKSFQSNVLKKQMLEQLEITPITELDKEINEMNKVIEEIRNDDTLSDRRKELLILILNGSKELMLNVIQNPREIVDVKIQKIHENAILPTYAHNTDAGADIYSIEDVEIPPHTTTIVKTGLKVAIPIGYEIQIRPRSGMSLKTTLRVANAPGTIDSEYRGEIGVIIENIGDITTKISRGDKIAQMLIAPTPMIKWIEVNELDETSRGEDGYGSTDKS